MLAVAAAAALCVGLARADGDPASDTLVFTNAYLPAHAPSKANADALLAQIAAAYSAGYRVKVAVVAARYDLGAIPSLFGKPATYARFLGEELAGVYVGPLLIVMPSGYGIYDGGRSTAAESAVLAALAKPASTKPDDLTTAATAAVGELLRRGALRSRDILPPYVETVRATAVGTQLKVLYYLSDDSGRASATLEILRGGEQLSLRRSLRTRRASAARRAGPSPSRPPSRSRTRGSASSQPTRPGTSAAPAGRSR